MNDGSYAVHIEAARPTESSRAWALLFVLFGLKAFALIVHLIVLLFYGIAAAFVLFVSQLVVLFTGRYPEGMHAFVRRVVGQGVKVNAWLYGLTDVFPPFAPGENDYPVKLTIEYPQSSSRGWALATILFFVKALALIPHAAVLYVLELAMGIVVWVANVIVLFTGEFPDGMRSFAVSVLQWQVRVSASSLGLRDEYPPFSMT